MNGKHKVALTLEIQHEGAASRRETHHHEILKIGRDPRAHVKLVDESAGRMHAIIEATAVDAVTLIDLGNEPGTLLNGARVTKQRLSIDDEIRIGKTTIRVLSVEAYAEASQPPVMAANPFVVPSTQPFAWSSPFSAPTEPAIDEVAPDAPEGSYTYALVQTGPAVAEEEVEVPVASVEIMIAWGASVLHVAHLTPPRSFYVGEEERKHLACDYFLPSDRLGTTRMPIVLASGSGSIDLVLPADAQGTLELAGEAPMTVEQARSSNRAMPCAELSGAHQIPLPPRSKAKIEIGGIVFTIGTVNAGRDLASSFQVDTAAAPYHALSALMHVGLLAAAAVFMPPLSASATEDLGSDQQYILRQLMNDAEGIKDQADRPAENNPNAGATNNEGGTGKRAIGEEGKMGSQTSNATNKRWGSQGPATNPDPQLARIAALRDAADFGMIGLINTGAGGDPKSPTVPWGGEVASGKDPISALGNMWGADIGDAAGANGLGLTGIGEGGGGNGLGVGLGTIGTYGHGSGLGDGQGFGPGNGGIGSFHGRLPMGHKTTVPTVRVGTVNVGGHLPPEVIQRIVRQNFGRFRLCYENGLRNSPNLSGRVAVRFVIGRDGAVSNVGNGGSDLPDSAVVSCVVRAFYGLSFPQPDEGGIVTVVYPIMFTPGT